MIQKVKKGFTLVELVIVIAVIAILAAVLLPTFAGVINRARSNERLQMATNARKEYFSSNEQFDTVEDMEGLIISVQQGQGENDWYYYIITNGELVEVTEKCTLDDTTDTNEPKKLKYQSGEQAPEQPNYIQVVLTENQVSRSTGSTDKIRIFELASAGNQANPVATSTYKILHENLNEPTVITGIEFGLYPQRKLVTSGETDTEQIVVSQDFIEELGNNAGTLPTSSNAQEWTPYNYYYGDDDNVNNNPDDYMWYIDVTYNDEQYRGVYFTSYRPEETTQASSTNNSIQHDNGYYMSDNNDTHIYWFKYEPIKWDILSTDNGVALVLSRLILDSQQFYYTTSDHTDPVANANSYEYSDIKTWLGTFYTDVLSGDSKSSAIVSGNIDTETTSSTDGTEKIFLLSKSDAENTSLFTNADARKKSGTAYAKANGLYADGCYSCWWLRSANPSYSYCAYRVSDYGSVASFSVYYTKYGACPALYITL